MIQWVLFPVLFLVIICNNAVFSVCHLFKQIDFFLKKKRPMNLPTILIQVRLRLNEFLCLLINKSPVGLSLEELGIRALERIPRDKAIDGIHAFNELRYVSSVLSISFFFKITNNDTTAMI